MQSMKKLKELQTREDLALYLTIPLQKLTYILYKSKPDSYYDTFEIPKKNGESRQIHAPSGDLKQLQKKLAQRLWDVYREFIEENEIQDNISHAFQKGKSIITNANIHRNKRYVLNLDLKDFFDHFHFGRVRGFFMKNKNFELPVEIATMIAQLTCYEGKLPQGAPTSPIITNLVCNILDMRLLKIAKKYRVVYTRYADDMTFSTNDKKFLENQENFMKSIKKEIESFGFEINDKKTRLLFCDSRQEVTGLVVNKKISVNREYCKRTRAMADAFYRRGIFEICGEEGSVNQLEGRFSFINQIDCYNNKNDREQKHTFWTLNARERQYQKFLFFKYFYANTKPLIVTEGKTDIVYLRAALKKYYKEYPELIKKQDDNFEFQVTFLRRSSRLKYFLGIQKDGADTMKNIYNFYSGKNNAPKLYSWFAQNSCKKSQNPVIFIFDNEQVSDRPLKKFLNHLNNKGLLESSNYNHIQDNLYILTNPLVNGKKECEIEDLFDDVVLSHTIAGKIFSRKETDNEKYYGKAIFSQYVEWQYDSIDFSNFKPMLEDIKSIVGSKKQG